MRITRGRGDVEDMRARRSRTLSQPRPLWWREDACGAAISASLRLRVNQKD